MKKLIKGLPEVHILGDLKDVKKLISGVNRKKTLVIFQDGDEGSFYLEIEKKFQPILQKDINQLAKEYRLIFFSFFPSRKKAEPVIVEPAETVKQEKKEKKVKEKKEEKKTKSKKKKK
ncbi:MAG: hypothetical protein NT040_15970 [Bacteroidetes bacterium]|nr:hypothetical protein [Bacteroidota bacterium]